MLLDPELRARLERLALRSRQRVRAQWSGRHASKRKGESLDFADYREYVEGDDFRRIDHSLWARLGVLLVRQFEAEEELPLRVVLDVSRSMSFYGKFDTARLLSAMIAYLGLAGGDRVQLIALPGPGDASVRLGPIGRHLSAWPRLELWLEALGPVEAGAMAPPLRKLVGEGALRGSVVLVSDLLTPEWEVALDGLLVGAGGIVLHVLAQEELDPELAGDLRLIDAESGAEVSVSTSAETKRAYRGALGRFLEAAAGRTHRAGLDYVLVDAGPQAADRVLSQLAAAEAVR